MNLKITVNLLVEMGCLYNPDVIGLLSNINGLSDYRDTGHDAWYIPLIQTPLLSVIHTRNYLAMLDTVFTPTYVCPIIICPILLLI